MVPAPLTGCRRWQVILALSVSPSFSPVMNVSVCVSVHQSAPSFSDGSSSSSSRVEELLCHVTTTSNMTQQLHSRHVVHSAHSAPVSTFLDVTFNISSSASSTRIALLSTACAPSSDQDHHLHISRPCQWLQWWRWRWRCKCHCYCTPAFCFCKSCSSTLLLAVSGSELPPLRGQFGQRRRQQQQQQQHWFLHSVRYA